MLKKHLFLFAYLDFFMGFLYNIKVNLFLKTGDIMGLIKKVSGVEFLTGRMYSRKELTDTEVIVDSDNHAKFPEAEVCGTDLGVPFYNSKNDTMYLLFGDTFGPRGSGITKWRSSVMSYSTDYDLKDGLTFDGWFSDQNGLYATAVSEGKHYPREELKERTKIPQGGIEVNGTVYIYYESIRTWGKPGTWYVNYQGVLKSTDNCKTFERVPDLTWFTSTTDEHFEYAKYSATWDYWGNDTDAVIDRAEEREAPYFAQCYPVDGKDGYVYIFGRKAGRQNGVKVARVKYEDIEKFSEHEYYAGNDKEGNPIWIKGYEGLKAINNDTVGFILASNENEPTSNMSVMYNEYLGKWMFVYFRPAVEDENGNKIYDNSLGFRLSDVPYGNYGEYHQIFDKSFFTKDGVHHSFMGVDWVFTRPNSVFYSAFIHEKYTEEKGKVFYLIVSITNPIYNSILMKVELE